MNNEPNPGIRGNSRGSILVVSLFLIALVSFSAVLMARTIIDHQRLNTRRHNVREAFYAAEAGVALVLHWGNFPTEFTPDPNLFASVGTNFPALQAKLAQGGELITHYSLQGMNLGSFVSDHGDQIVDIKEIELLPPDAGDPIASLFKVRSVGQTPEGIERTVLVYLQASTLAGPVGPALPAALITLDTAAAHGNARVHWGEAWSQNDFEMLNKSQMSYLVPGDANYDADAIYRTEGQFNFPANWQWGNNKDLFDAAQIQPGLAPASGDYAAAFYQHLPAATLDFPDLAAEYQSFKDLALANGRYYSTDAAGNIYEDGIEDPSHEIDFTLEFSVADRQNAPSDLVFIDTIDGYPPAVDGSNLADISVSGTSSGLKGVFWIGANFDISGIGNPPSYSAEDPDGNPAVLSQILLVGVLYASGTIAMGGNAGVYGSVFAQRGFTGGGTPDIYYNANLADGLEFELGNIGSVFKIALQTNY